MTKPMTAEERLQPTRSDPQEQTLRQLLEKEFSTEFSQQETARLRLAQLEFMAKSIKNLADGENKHAVRTAYLLLLSQLASTTKIKSGIEQLEKLPVSGFIVATNHLAMPKATRFSRYELGEKIGDHRLLHQLPQEVEPFPIRHAAIAATLGQKFNPHEIAIELPSPYGVIQRASQVIVLPSAVGGRFQVIADRVKDLFSKQTNEYVITYPESGTTGKRGGGGLYGVEREEFHTGFLRLAKTLQQELDRQIPIIILGQAFHPEDGFRTGVLEPVIVDSTITEDEIEGKTRNVQEKLSTLVQQLRYNG